MKMCFGIILLLVVSDAWAQASAPAIEWELRRAVDVPLDGGKSAHVEILRARNSSGTSGTGAPLFSVDATIATGATTVFQFTSDAFSSVIRQSEPYFVDDEVAVLDVTGDGVPEVMFHSGDVGASGFSTRINVISRIGKHWRDIGRAEFFRSEVQRFRWMTEFTPAVAVVAEPIYPQDSDDERSCHFCRHYYDYRLFQWSSPRKAFVNVRALQSSRDFAPEVDPLEEDKMMIKKAQKNR